MCPKVDVIAFWLASRAEDLVHFTLNDITWRVCPILSLPACSNSRGKGAHDESDYTGLAASIPGLGLQTPLDQ